jgi:hypothetical protein
MKKKQAFSNVLAWCKDVGLKVFAILALAVGGFYAYAAITWPANPPNPTPGVVGMFVGESTASFDASSSYSGVNGNCANGGGDLAGSHICTPDEMANSYNHQNAQSAVVTYPVTAGHSATLWVNSGTPGYTANANDCQGWSAVDSPNNNMVYGTVWNFESKSGGLLPCTTGKKFACCK